MCHDLRPQNTHTHMHVNHKVNISSMLYTNAAGHLLFQNCLDYSKWTVQVIRIRILETLSDLVRSLFVAFVCFDQENSINRVCPVKFQSHSTRKSYSNI